MSGAPTRRHRATPWAVAAVAAATLVVVAWAQTLPRPVAPLSKLSKESKMPDNKMFEQVPLNSGEPNACSPAEPPDEWTGLVIQAPTQVAYRPGKPVDGSFTAIPVCGYYRLEMAKLLDGQPLMLVAVDLKSQTRHVGAMLDMDPGMMAPPRHPTPPIRPQDVAGMSTAAYFNPNLARYVKLPAVDAVYRVHAEYGGAVSNSVQIAIVRR